MTRIEIVIPEHLEKAFEMEFPGNDKAASVLRLIQKEIEKQKQSEAADKEFEKLVEDVRRIRNEPPYFSDEDIRKTREAMRK